MSETRAEMHGSYLALFSFACAMILLQLFFDSRFGALLWGLTAWQIYKRNKPTLVITLKLLFWLIIAGGIASVIWILFDPRNDNLTQFVQTERLGLAISAGLFWWMRSYFETSPGAADILGTRVTENEAPADVGITTVGNTAPEPYVGNTLASVVASPSPTPTVEYAAENVAPSAFPVPPAANIPGWVIARAKQVMFWRRLAPQPAVIDQRPAIAVDIADPAPLPLAAPTPAASSPEIKPAPVYVPQSVPPAIPSAIAPPAVIEDDLEERIYAAIANELETGSTNKGLWTRLYAECDGDEKRTKVLYIRQRAEKMISAERLRRLTQG